MERGAIIHGQYRYSLWREWGLPGDAERRVTFVMLNPSTADDEVDDPTIRSCIRLAKAWGYNGFDVVNLFPHRSTDPRNLRMLTKNDGDPLGVRNANDSYVFTALTASDLVVVAWGANARHYPEQVAHMRWLLRNQKLHHIGLTKDGHPKHPLYARSDVQPQEWK